VPPLRPISTAGLAVARLAEALHRATGA
jgi:hypothetical protein